MKGVQLKEKRTATFRWQFRINKQEPKQTNKTKSNHLKKNPRMIQVFLFCSATLKRNASGQSRSGTPHRLWSLTKKKTGRQRVFPSVSVSQSTIPWIWEQHTEIKISTVSPWVGDPADTLGVGEGCMAVCVDNSNRRIHNILGEILGMRMCQMWGCLAAQITMF